MSRSISKQKSAHPSPTASGGEGTGVRGNHEPGAQATGCCDVVPSLALRAQSIPLTPAPLPRKAGGEGAIKASRYVVTLLALSALLYLLFFHRLADRDLW